MMLSFHSSTFERSLINPLTSNISFRSTEHIIHWMNFCMNKKKDWMWVQSQELKVNKCILHVWRSSYTSNRPEVRMWSLGNHQISKLERTLYHVEDNATTLHESKNNYFQTFPYPVFFARHDQHIPHFLEDLLSAYSLACGVKRMSELQSVQRYVFIIFPHVSEKLLLNRKTWHGNIILLVKETVKQCCGIQMITKGAESMASAIQKLGSEDLLCYKHLFYNTRAAQRPESYTQWLYSDKDAHMLQQVLNNKLKTNKLADFIYLRKYPKMIMIQREKSRRIANAEEIVYALKRDFNVELVVLFFEHMSVNEQVNIMHKASLVISAHGAALSNIVFMKKGSILVELSPYLCSGEGYFGALAKLLGLRYFHLSGNNPNVDSADPYISPRNGCEKIYRYADIHVPLDKLSETIKKAIDTAER
eukprot:jgi/Galph1/1627/GphlegSOOS_G304.1